MTPPTDDASARQHTGGPAPIAGSFADRSPPDPHQGSGRPVRVSARPNRHYSVTALTARKPGLGKEALSRLPLLDRHELREEWRRLYGANAVPRLSRGLLIRAIAYRLQELALGGLRPEVQRQLRRIQTELQQTGAARTQLRPQLPSGTRLIREWQGRRYEIVVLDDGFSWQGNRYRSLSAIARRITGTAWSGPLFFGLKQNRPASPVPSRTPFAAGEIMERRDVAV